MQTAARSAVLGGAPLVVLLVVPGIVDGFGLPKVVAILMIAAVVAVPALTSLKAGWPRFPTPARTVIAAAILLLALATVSLVVSDAARPALFGMDARAAGFGALSGSIVLALAVPLLLRFRGDVDRVLRVLAGTLGAFCLYVLIQRLGLDPGPWAEEWQTSPVGTVGNPNFVGAIASFGPVLAVHLWRSSTDPVARVGSLALGAASLLSLVLVNSRLGLLSAAVSVLVLAGIGVAGVRDRIPATLPAWIVRVAPLGGVLVGVVAIALGTALGDRNSEARWWIWRTSARMVADQPVAGVGIGRYGAYYRAYRHPEDAAAFGRELQADSSHAWLIDLASTLGLPGALLWLAILVCVGGVLASNWKAVDGRNRWTVSVIAALLVAHGVQSSISIPTPATVWLGWLLVGLALVDPRAAGQLPRRSRSGSARPTGARLLVWSGTVLLIVGVLAVTVPTLGSARLQADAVQRQLAGDVAGERVLLSDAAARSPWWPRPWRELAALSAASGDAEQALRNVDRALQSDPRDSLSLGIAVTITRQVGPRERAEQWFDEALRLDPAGIGVNLELAEWALDVGDHERASEAIDRLERAVAPSMDAWDDLLRLQALMSDR